ncbi:hypothetical protein LP420_24570 [Massilia sp. B-10]|nr:hypothetical protein LP420_24570 [Massilia sp. B-10]
MLATGPAGLAAADRHRCPGLGGVRHRAGGQPALRDLFGPAGPHFVHRPWKERFLLGFVSGDITVNLFLQRFPDRGATPGQGVLPQGLDHAQLVRLAGLLHHRHFPRQHGPHPLGPGPGLSTLAIICILVPAALTRASLAGVVVAGAVAVLAYRLPYKLGLLTAVLVGMLCAMAVEEWSGKGHKHD